MSSDGEAITPSTPTPTEIKVWRESAGLTQAQAAALIGYTARAWENWEQGARTMRGTKDLAPQAK